MSKWITDRLPTEDDEGTFGYLWVTTENGVALLQSWAHAGAQPWMPITPPEPYVKPKRYVIRCYGDFGLPGPEGYWCVYDTVRNVSVSDFMPREAAERIAAICEEVKP